MGQVLADISPKLRAWIEAQPMYFVGSAPSGDDGHVNISPKGGRESFAVLGPLQVAYLDMTGSGAETIAHLRENGRIVVMFCAFAGAPKIIRLHGSGRVVLPDDAEFAPLLTNFPANPDILGLTRAVIVVDVNRVADSCGFTVPRMELVEERDQLYRWAAARNEKEAPGWLDDYRAAKNACSIDGLPALSIAASAAVDPR